MRKHIRDCVRLCEREGLTEITIANGGKHLKLRSLQGSIVLPNTPSDYRWRDNFRSQVRKLVP